MHAAPFAAALGLVWACSDVTAPGAPQFARPTGINLDLAPAHGTNRAAILQSRVGPNLCMDVIGWPTTAGATVGIWGCNGELNQRFTWGTDGAIRVSYESRTWCLDGATWQIVINTCNGGSSQRWEPALDGLHVRMVGTTYCMDVPNWSTAWGTRLGLAGCWGATAQQWDALWTVGADFATTCGVRYKSITKLVDTELGNYGVPTQTDTVQVCETWTGSDYKARIEQIGSSEPASEYAENIKAVEFVNGNAQTFNVTGATNDAAENVGVSAFDVVQATEAERDASYNEPYLVSRRAYLKNPANIAGIVTIGSPHQGAIIADNASKVTSAGARLVSDFFGTVVDILLRPTPTRILSAALAELLKLLVNAVINQYVKPYIDNAFGLNTAALNDLKTTSTAIGSLKSTYDNAPHANVYGVIGKRNAVFRLAYSALYKDGDFDGAMKTKNRIKSGVKVCAQIGYNWIVKTTIGKMCHKADRAIGGIDDRWVQWTLNGNRNLAFDGLLPNSDQVDPGMTLTDYRSIRADGANHMNLQYDARGINATVNAMRAIQMRSRTASPPPPPPPDPDPTDPPCGGTIRC